MKDSSRRCVATLLLGGVLLWACPAAPAQADPYLAHERCLDRLDDREVTGRLRWIESMFRRNQRRARVWLWSWFAVNAGIVGAASALAYHEDDALQREAFIVGAGGAAASMLVMVLPPPPSTYALRRLQRMPTNTPDQRYERLVRAEHLLQRAARNEQFSSSAFAHSVNVGFATAEFLFLSVRYPQGERAAVVNALITLAVTEAQAFTVPDGATSAFTSYRYGSRPCMAPQVRDVPVSLELVPARGGIGLALTW